MPKSTPRVDSPSLYIHIPFCTKCCPYCNFYKKESSSVSNTFINALCQEIRAYKEDTLSLKSIFFGGGTPNLLTPEQLNTIMEEIHTTFTINKPIEVTMEMNPEKVTEEGLLTIEKWINRASIGVQSFDTKELTFLGREHTQDHIHRALTLLNQSQINNINIDLIFASPIGTLDTLKNTLDTTLTYNPTHISTYSLSIEDKTAFKAKNTPKLDEGNDLKHYNHICQWLPKQGYPQYEISAFSQPGKECQHNLSYWELTPYIGVGPSACSYYQNRYYENPRSLTAYLKNPTPQHQQVDIPQSDPKTQLSDYLLCNLRLMKGIHRTQFKQRFGYDLTENKALQYQPLVKESLLDISPERITVTPKGRPLLDEIIEALLP